VSQEEHSEFPDGPQIGQPSPRGFPKIAWCVIAGLVIFSMLVQGRRGQEVGRESLSALQRRVVELQGQYLVAASQVLGAQNEQFYESAKSLNAGPPFIRLRFIALAGELMGPDEALKQMDVIQDALSEQDAPMSQQDERVLTMLHRLYSDYEADDWDAPSLEPGDRGFLTDELGWFGELALSPKPEKGSGVDSENDSRPLFGAREEVLAAAWRTFGLVILATMLMMGVGIAGLAGAVIFLVLVLMGKIRSAIHAGSGNGAIYAETFAVWMLLFIALTLVASLIIRSQPDYQLLVSSAASILSLGALIWPIVRGVPWDQVRRDIGLVPGKRPIVEILWGVVCYVSNVPVVVIGLLVTLALLSLYSAVAGGPAGLEPSQAPAHPVIEWVSNAGWAGRISIILLACLIAPVIEETVFRGILYRHLRDGTAKWRVGASVAFSTALNSFIFAVIHPQGLLAAPALMGVAAGLSLAREWRGSLLAPMAMHATNNSLMMLLLFSLI